MLKARSVILALGSQHRHLNIPGEIRLTGYGVSYCAVCDAGFFAGKTVFVVGGGDSAIEEVSALAKFARRVVLVHRRDSFRASAAMVARLESMGNVETLMNHSVVEVFGESRVQSLRLRDTISGEETEVKADGLFIAVGHDPRSSLVREEVRTDSDGYVLVNGRTTEALSGREGAGDNDVVSGVFACGDLVDRRYRQAITAAGSGCAAALDAQRFLENLN